jgi:hypothetical protein
MVEVSTADFMELTIREVSDLLLEDIDKSGKKVKGALLYGKDEDGKPYRLSVVLELICDE